MSQDLFIVGHGGLGREVAFLVDCLNQAGAAWNLRGYVGSRPESCGCEVGRGKVVVDDEWLAATDQEVAAVLAIGIPGVLEKLYRRFSANRHIQFPSLVHPSVTGAWPRIRLGQGNIVLNGAAFTTDIACGSFNIINPGCTLAHDCVLGSYNLLGPGVNLAGGVRVGDRVLLGTGAKVLPGVSIGDDVVLGAGAVLTKSIGAAGIYVGIPARRTEITRQD